MEQKNKYKDFFTKNLALKLLSVIFAFVVWLVVVNIENPSQTRNFTSSVIVENEQLLIEQGKYYSIHENSNVVTFRVTAPRNIIESLSSDDFNVIADMENLEADTRIPVEIELKRPNANITISSKQQYLYIDIGTLISQEFKIEPEVQGEPAKGFVLDQILTKPEHISVTGPQSVVSLIDRICVYCDVTDVSGDISRREIPVLLDKEGNRIDLSNITMSEKNIAVDVKLASTKSVPIILEGSEQRPEGVILNLSPSTIDLVGDSDILNDITEIVVAKSVVDITQITTDVETTVDITRYLPEGVRLLYSDKARVNISIRLSEMVETQLSFSKEDVKYTGLGEGLLADISPENISVIISGPKDIIDNINKEDLSLSLDLSGMEVGNHTVSLNVEEKEGITISAPTVTVIISTE